VPTKYSDAADVGEAAARLESVLEEAPLRLLRLGEAVAGDRPTGMKWSRKAILGHLIDSASNNHQRFVRAQLDARMTFPRYGQEEWVEVQGYDERPWPELVDLWRSYNRHLLHVMRRVPASALANVCVVVADEPSSLENHLIDYVGHLQHHLDQILA
jgi:DinB superfamily